MPYIVKGNCKTWRESGECGSVPPAPIQSWDYPEYDGKSNIFAFDNFHVYFAPKIN